MGEGAQDRLDGKAMREILYAFLSKGYRDDSNAFLSQTVQTLKTYPVTDFHWKLTEPVAYSFQKSTINGHTSWY